MSRPPNSRASLGRTPSAEPDNRRASVHSLNLSYAYGAPATSTVQRQSSQGPEQDARPGMPVTVSGQRTAHPVGESGRAAEPAAVRYARLAQRKKDTGGNAYPPPPPVPSYSAYQNTSVNIANAFKAATSGLGGVVTGGRQEDLPANGNDDDDEEADQEENAAEDQDAEQGEAERDELEDEDEEDQEEREENGQSGGKAPSSAARKRKKHGTRDPALRDPAEQSSSSEDSGREGTQHQNKRTKVHSDDNDHVDDPTAINKPRRRTQKSADPTYRPLAGPNYRAGQTTTSDSEGDSPKRRRSKGKGRTSAGGRSVAQEAIPRGIRDGEIWYGKKRKARRSSRPASTAGDRASGEPEGVAEAGADAATGHDADDMGGMDPSGHDYTAEQDDNGEDGDATPPGATYFLRLKSPSPPSSSRAPAAVQSNVGASTSRATVDPAFAAFDRSLGQTGQDSNSLTASFDDSVLRGSSYDYSEEERIVQALEAQKRRRIDSQLEARRQQPTPQQPARNPHAPTPQTAGITATPIISNGGYPATPNAAPVSPVTALRRRRLPGPPSMLGAGTPLAAGDDADELVRAEKMGGELGRKLGNILRPLVHLAGRLWQRSQNPLLNWPRILKAAALVAFAVSLLLVALYRDAIPLPGRQAISTPIYVPPAAIPDSLEGVISRLADLESAVGRLSSASGTDRQLAASDRKAAKELQNLFRELENNLHEEQARSRGVLTSIDEAASQQAKQNGQAINLVKAEVAAVATQIQQASDLQRADAQQLRSLRSDVDDMSSSLVALKTQVAKVAQDVRDTTNTDRITKLALEAIGKKLPGKVAVWMDESGRLDIDPSFWRVLKDAFVDQKAVDKSFDTKLASLDGAKRQSLFGSSSKEVKVPAASTAIPSWDAFLAENEAALKAWISSDLSDRSDSGAFVSRRTFLDLLDRRIQTLRRDFETNAHDNFEQMGRELLAKVAKQDEMRRKDTAYGSALDASSRPGQTVTIKGSDGQNVTQVISSLVDSALLRYSKDVLARPDYALYTSGGRVIRSLTSKSYEPFRLGKVRSAVAWVTGAATPQSRPPVTALHPDTSPGSCWPFAGPHGQLGIQLSRRVVPTDVTLEHISPDVALDGDVSSAPKDFEVWGIVDDVAQVARVAKYRQEQLQAKRAARAAGTATEDDLSAPASLPESANHILLASGAYDPAASSPVQSFPVTAAARQLGIPIQVVVVKILSNHGESAYTCLYRVRISGSTPAQIEAAA